MYQNLLWSEELLKMYFKRNPSGITGAVPKPKNNVGAAGGFGGVNVVNNMHMTPVSGGGNIGARIFTMIPQQSYRELLYKTLASGWNQGPVLLMPLGLPSDQATDIGFLMAVKLQKRWEISDLLQQKTTSRKRSRNNNDNQVNGGGMMNPNSMMNPNGILMQQQQQQKQPLMESPEMLAQVAQNWQLEVYKRLLWWNNCFDNSCELKQAVNGKADEEIKAPADLLRRFQVPDGAEIVAYYTCSDPAFLQENSKKAKKATGKKDLASKDGGDDTNGDAEDEKEKGKDKKASSAGGMMGFGISESIYDSDNEDADSKDGDKETDKDAAEDAAKDAESKDATDKDAAESDDAKADDKTDKKADVDDEDEDDSKEGKKAARKKKLAERRQAIRSQRNQKKNGMQVEYMHVRFEAKPQALVKTIQGKMKEARFYETPSGSGVTYGVWLESLYFDKSRQKHVSVDVILTPTDLEAARAAGAPNALKDAEKKKLEEQAKAKAGLKGKSKNNKNAGGIMLDMYVLTMELDNIVGSGDSKNDAVRDLEAEEAEMAEFGFKRDKEDPKDAKDAKDSKKGSRLHRGSRKAATDEKDADDSNAKKKKRTPARSSRKSKG